MPTEAPESPKPDSPRPRRAAWILGGLIVLFVVVLLRTAWLSEDAYFTFRSVENWVYGYGARWNVNERVQVYTHPLWFGLMSLSFFITRHMAASAFGLCFIFTGLTVYLLVCKLNRSWQGTAMALGILIASKAFVDYSTSGLENPLSHFLLLMFFAGFWADEDPAPNVADRRIFLTSLVGGGLVCNRLDLGLVLAPALLYWLWPPRFTIRRVFAIFWGFFPLLIWEFVSLIYYGFLVPNTAYAKLGSGATSDFIVTQGTRYFRNSLEWDPVTLVCTFLIVLVALRRFREQPKHAVAAFGALLYVGYVFKIGGDYMSGRFFSAPLVVAAGLLANRASLPRPPLIVGSVVTTVLAFVAPNPTVLSGSDYSEKRLHTDTLIDDERGYRHEFAGLISDRESPFLLEAPWYKEGAQHREDAEAKGETLAIVNGNGGYMGYAAGPQVHYINPYAITDPLLARLPGRIGFVLPGHFRRHPPSGYAEAAVMRGEIEDPDLAKYWDDLSLIVSGPIWSSERWEAIWRMHTGANQHLLDAYLSAERTYEQVSVPGALSTSLRNHGVTIVLGETHHEEVLSVRLERDDVYAIELYRQDVQVHHREVGQKTEQASTRMVRHRVHIPSEIAAAGYDELRILPVDGSGTYRMGRLRLLTHEQAEAENAAPKPTPPEPAAAR
ncbi:MAG: hypothetical protein ACRBN8_14635 [Nannocystales bacterium]